MGGGQKYPQVVFLHQRSSDFDILQKHLEDLLKLRLQLAIEFPIPGSGVGPEGCISLMFRLLLVLLVWAAL